VTYYQFISGESYKTECPVQPQQITELKLSLLFINFVQIKMEY